MRAWSLWHYAKATHPLLPLASPHPAPPLPPPQLCLAGPWHGGLPVLAHTHAVLHVAHGRAGRAAVPQVLTGHPALQGAAVMPAGGKGGRTGQGAGGSSHACMQGGSQKVAEGRGSW